MTPEQMEITTVVIVDKDKHPITHPPDGWETMRVPKGEQPVTVEYPTLMVDIYGNEVAAWGKVCRCANQEFVQQIWTPKGWVDTEFKPKGPNQFHYLTVIDGSGMQLRLVATGVEEEGKKS